MNTSVKTKCQELDRQHFLLLNRKLEPSLLALLEQWGLTLGLTSDQIAKQTTLKERGSFLRVAIGSKKMLLVVDDAWQKMKPMFIQCFHNAGEARTCWLDKVVKMAK